MQTRRDFLSRVSRGTLLSLAPTLSGLWQRAASAAESDAPVLVVLELNGGNDGLNTVVPFADDVYHRSRPTLRIKRDDVLKLNDRVGLHPSMTDLYKRFIQGEMAIVQNVGYPNPVRSHFRSMDTWHSGVVGAVPSVGWLGRAAEADPTLQACFIGSGPAPLALQQRGAVPLSLAYGTDLTFRNGARLVTNVPADAGPLVAAVARRMRSANQVAAGFEKIGGALPSLEPSALNQSTFDDLSTVVGRFIHAMRVVLESEPPRRILYMSVPGFDTHRRQSNAHGRLLAGISKGLSSFLELIRPAGLADRVLVLVFSEFGRRLQENQSAGTDHGTGGPVFLIGKGVRGGLYGAPPDLTDLDDVGDPKFSTDFRDVYAAVLRNWLRVDPEPIVPDRTPLPILTAP